MTRQRPIHTPAIAGSPRLYAPMATLLLLVLGTALFGALAGYVIFCERV
jgi:hypothetical protein